MHVITRLDPVEPANRGAVIALGNFDGFHRGHQAVVAAAGWIAKDMATCLGVFTTEPHPRQYFRPDTSEFRITPGPIRQRLLTEFGVDILFCPPFDATLAAMQAQDFAHDLLVRRYGALHLVVGYDYRFGYGRMGNIDMLQQMGEMEGFGVTIIDPVTVSGNGSQTYSSSMIRTLLEEGAVRRAAELLGHCWRVEATVQPGDQRGRTIDFPTANLSMDGYMLPRLGVYAIRARLADAPEQSWLGVANLGRRPTFDKKDVLLEVHLFDFDADIYGRVLQVDVVDFIRPEQKFSGLDALRAQIAQDCDTARARLLAPENAAGRLGLARFDMGIQHGPTAATDLSSDTGPLS